MNPQTKKQKTRTVLLGLSALVLVGLGFGLRGLFGSAAPAAQPAGEPNQVADEEQHVTWWTCSMHPQIKLPKPGRCPICGMELIPLRDNQGETGSLRELTVSENAKKLMEIETVPVERKFVEARVRMVGKVDYDETRLKYITAWIPGRLDRLFVDYTGVPVKKGDHMVSLYSPELLSAQEELLQAIQAVKNMQNSDSTLLRDSTQATLSAAREKLRLWGLTKDQVTEIEQRGSASDHMTIYAPAGGIVIHKNAQEGMYVQTGSRIYTIADLSRVWVQLDAYESDLSWLHYGQPVEFTTESYPGEVFKGTISFINPVLTESTRTIKVRVDVANPNLRLKPGMFVRAVVRAQVATAGRVMNPDLAGKWICPMHPDVIKDQAGNCDICGMPLVRTESLGYVSISPTDADKPLVIPTTAALITGTRAIVYVEVPNQDKPTYEGREIVLGPKAGDYYLVRSGLKEGERVVTKGNFKIDAELQIEAKPSMMTPEGGGGGGMHMNMDMGGEKEKSTAEPNAMPGMTMTVPTAVQPALQQVLAAGNTVDQAVAGQELGTIRQAFANLQRVVQAVPKDQLTGHMAMQWQEDAMFLTNDGVEGKDVDTLADAQRVQQSLHQHLHSLTSGFGLNPKGVQAMSMPDHPQETEPVTQPISHIAPAFHTEFDKVVQGYLNVATALVVDQADQAKAAAQKTLEALDGVDMTLLTGATHMTWMKDSAELKKWLNHIVQAQDLEKIREEFALLSEQIIVTAQQFGWTGDGSLYQFHCPMAFNNRGANWVQQDTEAHNPYFGSAMPTCGSMGTVIAGE